MTIINNDESTFLFIPQFTIVDDSLILPYYHIEASDSFSLFEKSPIDFTFNNSDSFVASDSLILDVSLNLLDASSFVENISPLEIAGLVESILLSESIGSVTIDGIQDSVNLFESISNSIDGLDSFTLSEFVTNDVFTEEFITLLENIDNIYLDDLFDNSILYEFIEESSAFVHTHGDINTLDDISDFFVDEAPDIDTFHYSPEYQDIDASLPIADSPAILSENGISIDLNLQDAINLSESIIDIQIDGIALTDSINFIENIENVAFIISNDQFIYQEDINLHADYVTIDNASFEDSKTLTADNVGFESIALNENINITVSVSDSASLSEIKENFLNSSDSSNLIEEKIISLSRVDMIILSELTEINTSASGVDSANLFDIVDLISLAVFETNTLIETPSISVSLPVLDYVFLISENGIATILKEDKDFFAVTDSILNVGPNVFDLITFKEKRSIGISKPLILNINDNPTTHGTVTGQPSPIFNINDNPTVHGTVTGQPITISVGGTTPVLL